MQKVPERQAGAEGEHATALPLGGAPVALPSPCGASTEDGEAGGDIKALLIGIDALDWELWSHIAPPWLCSVPLESQVGLTGSEWTSMFTGIPVSTLGAYDYYGRPVGTQRTIVRYGALQGYYWWEIGEPSFSAAICRAPACYPPRTPKRGWILCGPGAHDNERCFASADIARYPPPRPRARERQLPPDPYLFGSLMHYCGHQSLLAESQRRRFWRLCSGIGESGVCSLAARDAEEIIAYFCRYAEHCDAGYLYFGLLDILLHTAEGGLADADAAEKPYRLVLQWVEALRAALRPAHLIIASDHGGLRGRHRSCGVLAWTPTTVMPRLKGVVRLGETRDQRGGPHARLLERVPVLEAPWHPWTYQVAEIVLRPLDLQPKQYERPQIQTVYTAEEQQRIERRLRELGYL